VDDEDDVVFGFKGGDDSLVIGLVGYGLFVDFSDDSALDEVDLVGKGARPNGGDHDTALGAGFGSNLGRDGRDGDAKFVLAGVFLLWCGVVVVVSSEIGVGLGAVADRDVSSFLFAVAEVAEFDHGANVTGGDVGYEVVAIFNVAAVNRDNDVTRLKASFGSAAVRSDGGDHDSVREAVHTADRGAEGRLEADADGAANDLVFGSDEHVVNRGDGVGRHGEADTLRAHGLGVDGGVHADDVTGHVDERAAGVAGVDGGVGLDEALELAL